MRYAGRLSLRFEVAAYIRKVGAHKLKIASHGCCTLVVLKLLVTMQSSSLQLPATNDGPATGIYYQ